MTPCMQHSLESHQSQALPSGLPLPLPQMSLLSVGWEELATLQLLVLQIRQNHQGNTFRFIILVYQGLHILKSQAKEINNFFFFLWGKKKKRDLFTTNFHSKYLQIVEEKKKTTNKTDFQS